MRNQSTGIILAGILLLVIVSLGWGYHAASTQRHDSDPPVAGLPVAAPAGDAGIRAIMGPAPADEQTLPVDPAEVPDPPDGDLRTRANWTSIMSRWPHPKYHNGFALQPGSIIVDHRVIPPYSSFSLR